MQSSADPEEAPVHFIESFFGLYPDAGNGLLELGLLAVVLSAIPLRVALSRRFSRGKTRTEQSRS